MSGSPERLPDLGHRAGSDSSWRVDDLEVELEKKVQLLEKERKALRLETEKHNQEIEWGINKLHHRISGLEEGTASLQRGKNGRKKQNIRVCVQAHFNVP